MPGQTLGIIVKTPKTTSAEKANKDLEFKRLTLPI